jgi:hypothetical protein
MVLENLILQLTELQRKMQHANVNQYMMLKRIVTPEQANRLSALYRELYGCPMKDKRMQPGQRDGQAGGQCPGH